MTITLTGYLGRDREIRDTQPRTVTVHEYNPVAEVYEEREFTTREREFAVFSLATHWNDGGRRATRWHRLILWNSDRLEHFNARLLRKGDLVEVTGTPDVYRFTDEDGQEQEIRQIVVQEIKRLRVKPRRQIP